jgi:hypothetical protein
MNTVANNSAPMILHTIIHVLFFMSFIPFGASASPPLPIRKCTPMEGLSKSVSADASAIETYLSAGLFSSYPGARNTCSQVIISVGQCPFL